MKRSETEPSETLSQRSSEDEDLLQRSTKKSKDGVVSGNGMALESESGSQSSMDSDVDPVGLPETVAETPVQDLPMGDASSGPQSDAAGVAGRESRADHPTVAAGNTQPRSYRDSVESCPTVSTDEGAAATGDRAASDPTGPTVHNPVTNARRVSASGLAPYGSWMLVTRTDRRQQGRPSDQRRGGAMEGQRANAAASKERAGTTGSRFNPLETVEDQEATNGAVGAHALDAAAGMTGGNAANDGLPRSAPQSRLEGRQRRSNVIANEKQIENEPISGRRTQTEVGESSRQGQHRRGSRRAAEEDEHIVNRGENGGNDIRTTIVSTQELVADVPAAENTESLEHHGDPPDGMDAEGDVVMEDDMCREAGPAGGTCDSDV
nr:uncharacterized protein LOC109192712 [Ipomoea batatas]